MVDNKINILRICNSGSAMYLYLSKQILDIKKEGYRIYIASSYDKKLYFFCKRNGIIFLEINFQRRFSFFKDIECFFYLFKYYYKYKFDISHSWNSKAGLLNSIVSFIFFTNLRIHTFAGVPWENMSLIKAIVPKICDFIVVVLNQKCFADSKSEANLLNRSLFTKKIKVLGQGSIAGVDLNKFNLQKNYKPDNFFQKNKFNIIFVGRITKEKGIDDLVEGFIQFGLKNCGLLILGNLDNVNGGIKTSTLDLMKSHKNIKWVKHTSFPEKFYKYANLCVLPSYREGFGNVVIEAACFQLPTFGYECTGLVDSILHNKTGVLVKKGNIKSLFFNINQNLLSGKYKKLGKNAYIRTINNFNSEKISNYVKSEYKKNGP
jgi:glycosyltransferase involved in cell wall biosynthesis